MTTQGNDLVVDGSLTLRNGADSVVLELGDGGGILADGQPLAGMPDVMPRGRLRVTGDVLTGGYRALTVQNDYPESVHLYRAYLISQAYFEEATLDAKIQPGGSGGANIPKNTNSLVLIEYKLGDIDGLIHPYYVSSSQGGGGSAIG